MMKRHPFGLLLVLLFSACSQALESKPVKLVFVCQQGYAKSLLAALQFERKAAAHGLTVEVIARGLTPAAAVPAPLASAMARDGFAVADYRPSALTEFDLLTADRVVSFAVEIPNDRGVVRRIDSIPPLSEDYGKARDQMNAELNALLTELLIERHAVDID